MENNDIMVHITQSEHNVIKSDKRKYLTFVFMT